MLCGPGTAPVTRRRRAFAQRRPDEVNITPDPRTRTHARTAELQARLLELVLSWKTSDALLLGRQLTILSWFGGLYSLHQGPLNAALERCFEAMLYRRPVAEPPSLPVDQLSEDTKAIIHHSSSYAILNTLEYNLGMGWAVAVSPEDRNIIALGSD